MLMAVRALTEAVHATKQAATLVARRTVTAKTAPNARGMASGTFDRNDVIAYAHKTDIQLHQELADGEDPARHEAIAHHIIEHVDPHINAVAETFDTPIKSPTTNKKGISVDPSLSNRNGRFGFSKGSSSLPGIRPNFASHYATRFPIATEASHSDEKFLGLAEKVLGYTNTPEFSALVTSWSERNPAVISPTILALLDEDTSAGGSSGGSGGIVGEGATPEARGSDVAGSLRIPGARCSLPTLFLSPNFGMELGINPAVVDPKRQINGLLRYGSLAKCFEDLSLNYALRAGINPEEFLHLSQKPPQTLTLLATHSLFSSTPEIDPMQEIAFQDALSTLRALGHTVIEDVKEPSLQLNMSYEENQAHLLQCFSYAFHADISAVKQAIGPAKPGELTPSIDLIRNFSALVTKEEISYTNVALKNAREQLTAQMNRHGIDALVMPVELEDPLTMPPDAYSFAPYVASATEAIESQNKKAMADTLLGFYGEQFKRFYTPAGNTLHLGGIGIPHAGPNLLHGVLPSYIQILAPPRLDQPLLMCRLGIQCQEAFGFQRIIKTAQERLITKFCPDQSTDY